MTEALVAEAAPVVEASPQTGELPPNAGESAETPPETPVEPPKPSAMERFAKAIAEQKAKLQTKQLAAEQRRYAEQRAQLEQERKAAVAERERFARLREQPTEALKELGWDMNQLNERVLRDGSPEAIARKAIEEAAAARRELAEWRQQQQAQQTQATIAQAQQAFANMVKEGGEDKFPHLTNMLSPAEIGKRATEVARAYFERTKSYASEEEIADFLEQQAAQEYESRSAAFLKLHERRQKQTASAVKSTASQGLSSEPAPVQADNGKKSGARTLTNRDAAVVESLPPDFWKLSDAEQNKLLVAQLKKAQK